MGQRVLIAIGFGAIGFQIDQMRRPGLHARIPAKAHALAHKPFISCGEKIIKSLGLRGVVDLPIGIYFGDHHPVPGHRRIDRLKPGNQLGRGVDKVGAHPTGIKMR